MTDQTWTLGNVRGEHPAASHHLPFLITAPGETDVLLNVMIGVSLGFCFLDRNILSPTASSTRPHGEQRAEDPIRNGCGSMSMPSVEPELTVSYAERRTRARGEKPFKIVLSGHTPY